MPARNAGHMAGWQRIREEIQRRGHSLVPAVPEKESGESAARRDHPLEKAPDFLKELLEGSGVARFLRGPFHETSSDADLLCQLRRTQARTQEHETCNRIGMLAGEPKGPAPSQ